MEKNQTKPKAVCEKIFRAITFGPAITTIRRLSNRQQTLSPTAVRTPQRPQPSSKQGSEAVPIKFDYTTKPKPITIHTNGGQAVVPLMAQQAKAPKPSTADHKVQSGKGKPIVSGKQHEAKNYDDKFTAFIHETREKIMTRDHGGNPQKVVDHHHGHRKDHQFTDYINQTKRKIKSTLSIRDRNESFSK